ncbi:MAG: hypothetical protein O2923_05585 [Verrucomicrobia bacterium]|nr:hypothetical protein [Verrucomicrobiota bacterium]MDA1087296.1 hypothetical protein [Verrucomicrobiota bacterium]
MLSWALMVGNALAQDPDPDAVAEEMVEESGDESWAPAVSTLNFGLTAGAAAHSNPFFRGKGSDESGTVYFIDPSVDWEIPVSEFVYLGVHAKVNYTIVDADDPVTGESSQDTLQPYIEARGRYNFSEFTSLGIQNSYQRANIEDDISGPKYELNETTVEAKHNFTDLTTGSIWYRFTVLTEESGGTLYDFDENAAGLSASRILARTESGGAVTLGIDGSLGVRDFKDGVFQGQADPTNPKNHDYYKAGLSLAYPIATGLEARGRAGWTRRKYEQTSTTSLRESESDSASVGFSLKLLPGGPVTYTIASSYATIDTIVVNIDQAQRTVFDTLDPLLNNLNTDYREMDVFRIGLSSSIPLSDILDVGVSAVYQLADADAEEDLAPASGQSGSPAAKLDEERVTVGGKVNYQVNDFVTLSVAYEHGFADDGSTKLYEYDAGAIQARLDI